MLRRSDIVLIAAGCILSILLAFGLCNLSFNTGRWFFIVGFVAVKVAFLAAYIMFVIQGFRVHWGWGLANLLIPLSGLVFFVRHRREGKAPMIVWISAVALSFVGFLFLIFTTPIRH
jgi:hypothetical protein